MDKRDVGIKMMALLLAMVMVLSMSISAFAADTDPTTDPTATDSATPTTYAITVDTSDDAVTHTYKVYQIFTGTPSDGKLTDIKYGSSYAGKTAGNPVPKTELDAIGTTSDSVRTWIATTFENGAENVGNEVAILNATTTSYDAVPGYYLVLDTAYTATATTADAYSAFMIQVVDEATKFTPKKEVPSVDKEVKDEADDAEAGSADGWGETADHEIGETFQFKLTATIPADANLKAYKTYAVQFNDTMSAGVTFEKINTVKVNGTAIDASAYTSTATAGQAGGSWTLSIADIKKISGVQLGVAPVTIEVEYDAHLNTAAAVNTASGTTTNKNTVTLTYSNNPDATGTGDTDTTPPDDVWVFTYGNNGTKEDANGNKLAGAGFELYAGSTTGTDKPSGTAISLYKVGNDYYKYDSTKTDYPTGGEVVTEMVTTTDGVFNIKGLDVGTYTLYEKTVPTGYVQSTNTVFKIGATHAETSGAGNVTLTDDSSTSETIVNRTGATLPSTGGIGTTIFYILGAILVLGAGIVLVTRRRMSAN